MSLAIAAEAPPLTVLENGAVRVTGTRMPLEVLVRAHTEQGLSAEQIAAEYAPLKLADVYAVLSYYHRHKDEVEQYLAESDARAKELMQKIRATQGPSPTRSELLKRRPFRAGEAVLGEGIWQGIWRCSNCGRELVLARGDNFSACPGCDGAEWRYVSPATS